VLVEKPPALKSVVYLRASATNNEKSTADGKEFQH